MSELRSGGGVKTVGSFFRLLELDASQAAEHPDVFDRLRRSDIHGLLLHNVYAPAMMRAVGERLERHDPPFLKTWFPEEFHSWFYGRNLNLAHPELLGYFQEAELFNEQLETLLPDGLGVTGYLADLLASLDGGRRFHAPPGPRPGQQYMFTTVRCHMEGGYIPPHLDNEFALRRSYRHLRSIVEPPILSFVLCVAEASDGGALEIFDFRQDTSGTFEVSGPIEPDISDLDSVEFRIPPGSVIVIDSGRYLHRVTPVVGSQARWTLCSFMARGKDHESMYCWG
ncbi:MAG TPA: 2OG-Fe(II) oxygenase [Acidobacteriota bacterium]